MSGLKILRSERRYTGKVFNLVVHEVEYESGRRSVREVAEHPGGAVCVPVLSDGSIVLVNQFRFPIGRFIYELPAGKLDPGEDPQHCASRELQEETGYVASSFRKLASIYTTPGFCNEVLHLFLATDLSPSVDGQRLEEGELTLRVEGVSMAKALEMIDRGDIMDGKSICGILMAQRFMEGRTSNGG
jgi:ADP-ribose pyrophosphatase